MELEEAATERGIAGGGGASSGGGDPDRLSALPDSLLHAIMSLLKARQAVQTCVLSTRWRHLWRSVPCLDVDHDEFRTTGASATNNHPAPNNHAYSDSDIDSYEDSDDDDNDNNGIGSNDKEWEDFEDFTENLMHRCNVSRLDSLRLHVNRSRAPSFADKQAGGWLRRAMKYCNPGPPRQREGLGSGSWQLKRLYLCNVALDNRFAKHVSSVCHSLEDLELEDCTCEIPAITSNSLKNLVLKSCRWRYLYEISSPTLKSLVIVGGSNTDDCVLVIVAPLISQLSLDVPLRFARRLSVNQK